MFYNLQVKEEAKSISLYKEAYFILCELESRDIYTTVKEKYIIDREGNKTNRVIECITWWVLA